MSDAANEQVSVTYDDLEKTLRIWITTAPKRIWYDYWRVSETTAKWSSSDAFDRFDPRHAMAAYLAARFKQVSWQVTHPPRENILAGIGEGGREPK